MMKRVLALILILMMLFPAIVSCGNKKDSKQYIGIISAMDNEIDVLLHEAKIDHIDKMGGVEFHVGTLKGKNVVITKSGIGKVRVSAGVTALLNHYSVSKVIFTGIAGGVADETQVMDEIIATRLVEHDYGRMTNDGLIWTSGDPGAGIKQGDYYYCDEKLVELAYSAAVKVVGKEHVFKGTIATGDQFIASEKYVKMLRENFDAYACEMEGASVAVVCMMYNVPFVVIRCLSDKADGLAHESYENFGKVAAANSSRIVLEMLDNIED